jgi:hypothetical protein
MQELLAGYQRFRTNGWPEKRGKRAGSEGAGCRLHRQPSGPGYDLRRRAGRDADHTQRSEPGAALCSGRRLSRHQRGAGIRCQSAGGAGHRRNGPRPVRRCESLLDGRSGKADEFVAPWMSIAQPACARALRFPPGEGRGLVCEHEVIKVSLANLMTFPWIAERVRGGELALHGAWFDIRIGALMILQPDGDFAPQE